MKQISILILLTPSDWRNAGNKERLGPLLARLIASSVRVV
jgi:hypothetical protein